MEHKLHAKIVKYTKSRTENKTPSEDLVLQPDA